MKTKHYQGIIPLANPKGISWQTHCDN